jgi:hypothetical protein
MDCDKIYFEKLYPVNLCALCVKGFWVFKLKAKS